MNLSARQTGPYLATTYSNAWQSHYFAQDYVSVDPVLRTSLLGILPVDWRYLDRRDRRVRRMFGESTEFGLGNQGLSFPIRGLGRETALFSINAHMSDAEWNRYVRHYMRDFQLIAHYLHNQVVERLDGHSAAVPVLSPREIECLRWTANGKTKWEIGEILAISERAAKFHLDQARHKLNCINVTNAVAKAVAMGLITVDV